MNHVFIRLSNIFYDFYKFSCIVSHFDHKDNDCLCIIVLTHGLHNDFICAKDAAFKSDKIWKSFTAEKCKSLAGKPKLFFFQVNHLANILKILYLNVSLFYMTLLIIYNLLGL